MVSADSRERVVRGYLLFLAFGSTGVDFIALIGWFESLYSLFLHAQVPSVDGHFFELRGIFLLPAHPRWKNFTL